MVWPKFIGTQELQKRKASGKCVVGDNGLARYKQGTMQFLSQKIMMKKEKVFETGANTDLILRK